MRCPSAIPKFDNENVPASHAPMSLQRHSQSARKSTDTYSIDLHYPPSESKHTTPLGRQ